MMKQNNMKIEIKATLENVAVVRVAISTFISNLKITIDELMDIKTAVSEAVTNAIDHGYDAILQEDSKVVVTATIISKEEDWIVIEVKDEGVGIEDIELAMTPAYTSKPELEHAGMGFTIMETFMDEVIIDSTRECGTTVTMSKKLRKKKSMES